MVLSKKIGLLAAPILFFFIVNFPLYSVSETGNAVIAVSTWMVVWWITEAVHIAVTALLPLVLFPLLGVMDAAAVDPIMAVQLSFCSLEALSWLWH